MIESLPEHHPHTCDKVRTGGGWSRDSSNPERCGKPAVVVDRNTCNCGVCDMSCHLCDYHARRSGTEAEDREDHDNWCDTMEKNITAWEDGERKTVALERVAKMRREGPIRPGRAVDSTAVN